MVGVTVVPAGGGHGPFADTKTGDRTNPQHLAELVRTGAVVAQGTSQVDQRGVAAAPAPPATG